MEALRQYNNDNQSSGGGPLRITLPNLSLGSNDGGTSSAFGGRIQSALGIKSQEEREADDKAWCPSLSYTQRLMFTVGLMFTGGMLVLYTIVTFPIQMLNPRRFVLTYTLGSVACLLSFSVYSGPVVHMKHLMSPERRMFTATYIGSLVITLYAAMALQSTILTLCSAVLQISSFLYYAMSYVPGGTAGLGMCCNLILGSARKTLPV